MASLQKNVASQNVTYCMIVAATGSPSTTTSTSAITAFVTKDGTQASAAGAFTYLGSGQWNYAPTQAETNATDVGIFVTMTSNIPCNLDFHTDVVDANGFLQVTTQSVTATAGSSIADQILNRDMSLGVDSGSSSVRTPRQAFRVLRNKVDTSSGSSLVVYKEDDATTSWTASITASSAAVPIVTLTPP